MSLSADIPLSMMRLTLATYIVALAVLATAAPQSVEQVAGRAIPITKRSSFANADKSANVDLLESHVASVRAKIARGLDNYAKNTGRPHPSVVKGEELEKRTGGLPLTEYKNQSLAQFWYGTIGIGTPAKYFIVEFDTGFSDLFVPSANCDFYSCEGHDDWDPTKSSTSKDLGKPFTLILRGNQASGQLYTDTVIIAGSTATAQTLGAVLSYSAGFSFEHSDYPADGVIGMGFEANSDFGTPSVFETLVQQNQVTDPVFSFKLTESEGEVFIGGSNSSLYTGDFSYVPVTQAGFWQVTMDNVQVNGVAILTSVDSIIDTGSALIMGRLGDVASLYKTLGGTVQPSVGDGYYSFPCDKIPTISFTFGGQPFPIPPSTLNIGRVGASDCISGIVGKDTSANSWVVGNLFLQGVYSRFDFGNKRVGFAKLA